MVKKINQASRVPVVSPDKRPLMPTTPARARKWIQSGRAVGKRNRVGVFYVQLLHEPSDYKTQEITVGVDRGKAFTGIAVQTKNNTIAKFHICLPGFYKSKGTKKDRVSITGKLAKRAELRRSRRARRIDRSKPFKLRNHREARFNNRRQSKTSPSVDANRLMELRVLFKLVDILPITEVRDESCGGNSKKMVREYHPLLLAKSGFEKWHQHWLLQS